MGYFFNHKLSKTTEIMETNNAPLYGNLTQIKKQQRSIWNVLFYVNVVLFCLTLLGFLAIIPGLMLMIPLGAINLITIGALLFNRIKHGKEVKCIIGYYAMALTVLLLGALMGYEYIKIDHQVMDFIMLFGVVLCMGLAGLVSYMLNVQRREMSN